MEIVNYLSKNIRYLRKTRQWSQEELASRLEIKRSNIAAYESKNVEPRLGLILRMAKLFNVNMAEFIHADIDQQGGVQQPFEAEAEARKHLALSPRVGDHISPQVLQEFVERSLSIRKMLEGFKIFYRFKKEAAAKTDEANASSVDIDNFLNLIDHMLSLNESLIDALGKNGFGSKTEEEQ